MQYKVGHIEERSEYRESDASVARERANARQMKIKCRGNPESERETMYIEREDV